MMDKENRKILDYEELIQMAKDSGITVVEAAGQFDADGLRFQRDGKEYIAIDQSLSLSGKTRALGFLLNKQPGKPGLGSPGFQQGSSPREGSNPVFFLRCPPTAPSV